MNEVDFEKRFNTIINRKEIAELESVMFFKEEDGSYNVFNRYKLVKKDKNNISVVLHNGDTIHTFYNMRNAVCWCVYDKRGKFNRANRIIDLDTKISGTEMNMEVHKRLFTKTKSPDDKLIYLAKLNEGKLKRKSMIAEIQSYLLETGSWQENQFKMKTEQ